MRMALTDKLKKIADAIRSKTGSSDLLTLDEMETAIIDMEDGALPDYDGIVKVTPNFSRQVLNTDEKRVRDDITVEPIMVTEVSNPSDGKTLII